MIRILCTPGAPAPPLRVRHGGLERSEFCAGPVVFWCWSGLRSDRSQALPEIRAEPWPIDRLRLVFMAELIEAQRRIDLGEPFNTTAADLGLTPLELREMLDAMGPAS